MSYKLHYKWSRCKATGQLGPRSGGSRSQFAFSLKAEAAERTPALVFKKNVLQLVTSSITDNQLFHLRKPMIEEQNKTPNGSVGVRSAACEGVS